MEDLTTLMNKDALVAMHDAKDSPEYHEITRQIPIQGILVNSKQEGQPIFNQFGTLQLAACMEA